MKYAERCDDLIHGHTLISSPGPCRGCEVWAVWPTVHVELSNRMVGIWRGRGYRVAVLIESDLVKEIEADKVIVQKKWTGFPNAVNQLCHAVPGDVVVVVGDDVFPSKEFTAQELRKRFLKQFPDTFGVIQPIGDDFASILTCAVSPWIGRAFIDRAYSCSGPFFEGYFHYYSDYELQNAAELLKCFDQWEGVSQYHDHWMRQKDRARPRHLIAAGVKHKTDKSLHAARLKKGYPGLRWMPQRLDTLDQKKAWDSWFLKHIIHQVRESVSGYGSSLENTKEIRVALPEIFSEYGIKTFTDVPCGDWNWMRGVDLTGIDYLGLDVVEGQIKANQKKFPGVAFRLFNLVNDIPRKSDLILCRDLLFHLPDEMIHLAISNLKQSGSKWLLTTTTPTLKRNKDLKTLKTVGWRAINLQLPPFNLPSPVMSIQENDSPACRGRTVALYDLENL